MKDIPPRRDTYPYSRRWISLYKIHSLDTGQIYILGRTTRFNKTFNTHISLLRSHQHGNLPLQVAFNDGQDLEMVEIEFVKEGVDSHAKVMARLYALCSELGVPWYGKEALS